MRQANSSNPPLSLKERNRQEREQLILQTAESVILEKGYYDTSIDEIAARVGIAKGTIYLHFPSKEDLALAIIQADLAQCLLQIDHILSAQTSATQALQAILQILYSDLFEKRWQFIIKVLNVLSIQHQLKERGTTLKGLWLQLAEKVSGVLEGGKATGEFATDIPTSVMLTAFLSLLSPKSYIHLTQDSELSLEEFGCCLGTIFFKGISRPVQLS